MVAVDVIALLDAFRTQKATLFSIAFVFLLLPLVLSPADRLRA